MIPDIVSDHVTDAARRLGLDDVHQLFLREAHERRDCDVHGAAQTAFLLWARKGYEALPQHLKDYCLKVCGGEVYPQVA